MTISSTTNRTVAATNGVTTVFPFGYKFLQNQDLVVLKTEISSGAISTLVLDSDYTVTGAGELAGGNVTITPALATGYKITVYRDPEATQELDLVANDPLPADATENAFDKLTMICQRLKERLARAFTFDDGTDSSASLEIPAPEANKYLAWNGTADALVNVAVATGSVISASTTASGIIELATQAEVNTGSDAVRAVTPATLAGSALAGRVTAAEADIDALQITASGDNLLLNGGFAIKQTSSVIGASNDNYSNLDGWYGLGTTGLVYGQTANPGNGYPFAGTIQLVGTSNEQAGFAQIVESLYCGHMRGQSATLSARAKFTIATTIHYAIVSWTGTKDAVTSDFVNNWASGSYTAGGFFIAANLEVVAHGSVAVLANTYTDLPGITGTVSGSMNNLGVMIWAQSDTTGNRVLSVEFMKLEQGLTATSFAPANFSTDARRAKRYFQHSFGYGAAIAQNAGVGTGEAVFPQVVAASTAKKGDQIRLPVEMRAAPSTTLYNPGASNAQARNTTASADCTLTTDAQVTSTGFEVEYTSPAGTTLGQRIGVHWKAEARL